MQDWEIVFWVIMAIGIATIPLMLIFDPTRDWRKSRETKRKTGKPEHP